MLITAIALLFFAGETFGKSVEEYISEAVSKEQTGDIDQAAQIMQEALDAHPDNPTVLGYLGGYIGQQAGKAAESGDMNSAGELTMQSFELLDRAIAIDSTNIMALLYRGVMGVNVPVIFGKLDQGINDLENLAAQRGTNPDSVPDHVFFLALDTLGTGYNKSGKQDKAYTTWKKIIELAPDTPFAEQADKQLKNFMTSEDRQVNTTNSLKKDIPGIGELAGKLEKDPDNPDLLFELAMAYSAEAEKGYDSRIYEDTTFLTNIAFEMVALLDKASKLAPDNMKIRLASGRSSVVMPFFVNRMSRGIKDLTVVIESDAPSSIKAEARFWLGYAYQKKATSEWIKVISDYPQSEAAGTTFDWIKPSVKGFDRSHYQGPVVTVDFILGFRDELPPQTAVWIEDSQGKFVKTVYVSGFSGFVKEKQVNLPKWSKSSEFGDVDGVTGASIDLGHHLYVWDVKDSSGKMVKPGNYSIKVETTFWPSMKYQVTSTSVKVGSGKDRNRIEEGNFIPYLESVYYP